MGASEASWGVVGAEARSGWAQGGFSGSEEEKGPSGWEDRAPFVSEERVVASVFAGLVGMASGPGPGAGTGTGTECERTHVKVLVWRLSKVDMDALAGRLTRVQPRGP